MNSLVQVSDCFFLDVYVAVAFHMRINYYRLAVNQCLENQWSRLYVKDCHESIIIEENVESYQNTLHVPCIQGIVYLNRNGNLATFLSYVSNAKKFKELFYPT